MNTTNVKFKGLTPLLMHNGCLADPLNPVVKELSALVKKAKKSKTDADQIAVRRAEWYGSLYVNSDNRVCLPGEILEACLVEGAKRYRLGKAARGGLIVPDDAVLDYDGPKSIDKLWDHGGFVKLAGVRIGQNRVIRSRPVFPVWSVSFDAMWDPELIKDAAEFRSILESAGLTGIGDWRPKFGRFQIVD